MTIPRTPLRRAAAALTAALVLSGCSFDPAAQAPFSDQTEQMPPAKMPKATPDGAPGAGKSHSGKQDSSGDPCAVDDTTLAACLPTVTALVGIDMSRGLAATEDGAVWDIRPGLQPTVLTDAGGPVRQLVASPTVFEDGQVFVLMESGQVRRLTVLPNNRVDWRDLDTLREPAVLTAPKRPGAEPEPLFSDDERIELISACTQEAGPPTLLSTMLEGVPLISQWDGFLLSPVTGVSFDNSIGGCVVVNKTLIVAVPGAQQVVAIELQLDGADEFSSWTTKGAPEVLVDGQFGHIEALAAVPGPDGVEIWGGTINRRMGTGGAADDRIVRIPSDGAGGASPV
ncbi:hypothetical protein KRX51_04320 [Corynebacterium sp. TAE3-ERU12]|uniref:hypothetical protein n=1 Tax=Corynebacterium sp. TAE3-ERU12 TaxID=2849491 RepID=UPI001C4553CC|nr:hypothetical protein [Corynebacterium sp. TAE3-ERU12]MBV7295144.1 hypothetical protein [Corynebacterium sp. TAE3-ERU12]